MSKRSEKWNFVCTQCGAGGVRSVSRIRGGSLPVLHHIGTHLFTRRKPCGGTLRLTSPYGITKKKG